MSMHRILGRIAGLAVALACVGAVPAGAFEAHNFLEPPFGSFSESGPMTVDPANGNVLVAEEKESGTVQVFGHEGGGPVSSFTGAGNPSGALFFPKGMAANDSGRVAIVDFSNTIYEYQLSESGKYEYLCEIVYYAPSDRCLANGGEASENTAAKGGRFEQA